LNIVFLFLNLSKYHCVIKNFHQIARKFILVNRHKLGPGSSFKSNVRRANLAFQTTIIVAIFVIILLILDLCYYRYMNAINDVGVLLAAIYCFYLITKGHITKAKLILVFSALTVCTLNSSNDGFNAGNQYLWFASLVGIFALFSYKEKKFLIISLFFLLATFIFCDITNFSLLIVTPPTEEFIVVNHHIIMYLSLVVCIFFMMFIAKSINDSFHDKDKHNGIIQKQKADIIKANRQLDKFVYHASHDLRTPLTSMLGLIEVSKKEGNLERMHNLLLKQEETILKLDDYVKDILVLSRIKTTEISPVLINLRDNIDGILKQFQFMLDEKKVVVRINLAIDQPFFTDGKRLNIILSNVLSNSIKYMDSEKTMNTIEISATLSKGKNLMLSIKDNGIGIESHELKKVFEMFYFNSQENKGTGLGLYIVKETVSNLSGAVAIKSEKGLFTTVEILLPNLSA